MDRSESSSDLGRGSVENTLAHFGKKGMKWGVRTSRAGNIKPRATLSRSDNRTINKLREPKLSDKLYSEVYRRSSSRIRQGTRQLNKNPKFVDKNFKADSPLRRSYYDAYSKMVTNQLNATVGSRSITNPFHRLGMATKRLELNFEYNVRKELAPRVTIRPATPAGTKSQKTEKKAIRDSVKHAAEDLIDEIECMLITNENGYIQDLDVPGEDLIQSDIIVEDILAHYGKMGMHWGRRKSRDTQTIPTESGKPTSVTLFSKPGKGVIKTKGGENRLPSKDAKDAAGYKQIARKSGTDSLSNQQLQLLNNRMNLQQSYAKIIAKENQRSKGKQFVIDTLKNEGKTFLSGKKGPLIMLGLGLIAAGYAGKHRSGTQSAAKVLLSNGKLAVNEARQSNAGVKGAKYISTHTLGNARSHI